MSTKSTYGAVCFSFCLPLLALAGPIDDLRSFTRDLKSLQGEFTQTSIDSQGKPGKPLSGTFALAQGGKFRFDYNKPFVQVLVSDGAKFATYDADLAQMTVRTLDESLASTPLAVLSGSAAIDSVFVLKALPDQDQLQWAAATPKQADAAVSDLRFGFVSGSLRALSWVDTFGKRTLMRFTAMKRNAPTEPGIFNFVPPAGTDIVGR